MSGRPRREVPKGYAVDLLRRLKDTLNISVTLINHVKLSFCLLTYRKPVVGQRTRTRMRRRFLTRKPCAGTRL